LVLLVMISNSIGCGAVAIGLKSCPPRSQAPAKARR
jgi:hypothetical protein